MSWRTDIPKIAQLILRFPSSKELEKDFKYSTELKKLFQSYFWHAHGILLTEYGEENAAVVSSDVEYNSFHKMFDISICDHDKENFTKRTQELISVLEKEGYVCSQPDHTWVLEHNGRPAADGLRFFVRQ